MQVYRIQKSKYKGVISTAGSTHVSGRWNLAGGPPIIYTSSNKSLAILEILAHLSSGVTAPKLDLITIDVPDDAIVSIEEYDLPFGWNKVGYFNEVQEWGTNWLTHNSSLAISVPSVISNDQNILINPSNERYSEVKVISVQNNFLLDNRLL